MVDPFPGDHDYHGPDQWRHAPEVTPIDPTPCPGIGRCAGCPYPADECPDHATAAIALWTGSLS